MFPLLTVHSLLSTLYILFHSSSACFERFTAHKNPLNYSNCIAKHFCKDVSMQRHAPPRFWAFTVTQPSTVSPSIRMFLFDFSTSTHARYFFPFSFCYFSALTAKNKRQLAAGSRQHPQYHLASALRHATAHIHTHLHTHIYVHTCLHLQLTLKCLNCGF